MTTTPISPVGSTGLTSTAPTRVPKQTMDSTVFMDLLVTQLKNQDPSSPMDTNAMIGQTTQLAEMEKLNPKSPAEKEEEQNEKEFLGGGKAGPEQPHTHSHGGKG